jgi:hypothetical protein
MSDPRYDLNHPANRPDPLDRTDPMMRGDGASTTSWILGALAIFAVIAGLIWMTSGTDTNVATRPATENTGAAPRTTPPPATRPAPAERTTPAPAPATPQ